MPPGDEKSEENVEAAETCGQKPVPLGGGAENGEAAEKHEAQAHDGEDGDGECASGHDAGAVEQQPGCGQRGLDAGAEQDKCEEGPGDQGRSESESDFAGGAGKQGQPATIRLPCAGEQSDGGGEKAFSEPDAEPGKGGDLTSGDCSGDDGRRAEKNLSPTGDGGEGRGALHGVANEAKVCEDFGGGARGRRRASTTLGRALI